MYSLRDGLVVLVLTSKSRESRSFVKKSHHRFQDEQVQSQVYDIAAIGDAERQIGCAVWAVGVRLGIMSVP